MGTAWVLAAMAAALGAFLFGRRRDAPEPPDATDERAHDLAEGLAPGSIEGSDDTRPSVADPTRREPLTWPANPHSGAIS